MTVVFMKDCSKRYVGQMERTFETRYKEHVQATKTNNNFSKYAQHLLDNRHSYGPVENTIKSYTWLPKQAYEHHRKVLYLQNHQKTYSDK
jgi:hypothetical protein